MGCFWNMEEVLFILGYVNEDLRKTHNPAKKNKEKKPHRLVFIKREFRETSVSHYHGPVKWMILCHIPSSLIVL